MIEDLLTASVRQRQQELRSLAADIARGRRAREAGRPVERRPFLLRLVALLWGLR